MNVQSEQRNSFFVILIAAGLLAVLLVAGLFFVTVANRPKALVAAPSSSSSTQAEAAVVAEQNEPAAADAGEEVASAESEPQVTQPTQEPVALAVVETAPAADLRLGVAPRSVNCELITTAVATIISDQYGLNVEIVENDDVTMLFEALEAKEVDITLCFLDPQDRSQISGENNDRIGYMRQIGSTIWNSGDGKLQIWAAGEAKSTIRNEYPCVWQLFENVSIADGDLNASSADEWLANNAEDVARWSSCTQ